MSAEREMPRVDKLPLHNQRGNLKPVMAGILSVYAGFFDSVGDLTNRKGSVEAEIQQVFPRPTDADLSFAGQTLCFGQNQITSADANKAIEIKNKDREFKARVANRYNERYYYKKWVDLGFVTIGFAAMAVGLRLEKRKENAGVKRENEKSKPQAPMA